MADRLLLFVSVALLSVSCVSSHRVLRHDEIVQFERAFGQFDASATVAEITLSFRSENLRGKVAGLITRASSEAYRIELIGQGGPFLKAYVTRSMMIIWPEGGTPLLTKEEGDVKLSDMIEGLPDWPVRCCFPLVFSGLSDSSAAAIRLDIPPSAELSLSAQSECRLVAKFSGRSASTNFPYKRIVIEEPGRNSRLVWKIKP